MLVRTLVLAALAAGPLAAQASPQPLELTCRGVGTANKFAMTTINNRSHVSGMVGSTPISGSGTGTSTVAIPRQQDFNDQVDLRLFNGDDRIRMPRAMLPGLRGGRNGWFKLRDVVADERSIRGSAAVNVFNNPKVFIDRVTGTISISGKSGDYSGQCEAVDANVAPKF